MIKKFLSMILALTLVFTIVACNSGEGEIEDRQYDVTFDLNYSGAVAPTIVKVDENEKVPKPSDPSRDGYDFAYWTLDGDEFEFTTEITKNITLKAKWDKVVSSGDLKINGVVRRVEVEMGSEYDPLDGVTAEDGEGNDISTLLDSNFQEKWLLSVGDYRFDIFVEVDGVRETIRVLLQVIGSESRKIAIEAPEAITYYIGSQFNALAEVVAYNKDDRTVIYDVELGDDWDDFYTAVPGTNDFTVVATDEDGRTLERTIKLTTKAEVSIPNELPKGQTIKVEMWHSNGSAIETALKRYATEFEALMRTEGYSIEVTVTKNGSTYDELRTNVVNALKGAKLPQLVQNYPDHVVEYNSHGVIASLLPYINHEVWGMPEDVEAESFSDILESYRREQRAVTLDGDYLSLPFNKSTEVVAYNKDMFDAVLKGNSFPRTWQELFSYGDDFMDIKDEFIDQIVEKWEQSGDKLSAEEVTKIKRDFIPFAYDSKANAFITLTRQFGGQYTGRDNEGKGQLLFRTDQVKSMLNYFGGNNDIFTIPEVWDTNYASDMFKKGYTALAIGSTGGIRYNTPTKNGTKLFNVGVAPMFYDENNPGRRSVIQQGTNISLTTEGTAEQQIAAWLFLKYLTSNEVQEDFSIVTGYSPIRNSVYSNPTFLEYVNKADTEIKRNFGEQGITSANYDKLYQEKVQAMALGVVTTSREYFFFDTPYIGSSAARNAVGVAFERVILRDEPLESSINKALDYAWDEASKVLER